MAVLLLLVPIHARAAAFTWSNGYSTTGSMNNGANWVGGVAPGSTAAPDVIFSADVTGSQSRTGAFLAASRNVKSITFKADTARAYTISLSNDGSPGTGGANLTFTSTNTGVSVESGDNFAHGLGDPANPTSVSVILQGNLAVSHNGGGTLSIPVAVTGAFGLTKSGTGTLILSGANTYTGDTTINLGTVSIGGGGKLGAGTYTGAITNNGALEYASSANQTLSGAMSGTGSLTKSGAGTLTLSGAVSYSGDTTVSEGTLMLGSANANQGLASISIASTGAGLNLAFAGTETVDKLFIGGTQVPAGVYEAVGNPGPGIEIAQLTGSGTLTVNSSALPAGIIATENLNAYAAGITLAGHGSVGNGWAAGWISGAAGSITASTSATALTYSPLVGATVGGGTSLSITGTGTGIPAIRQLARPQTGTFYAGMLMKWGGALTAGKEAALFLTNSQTNLNGGFNLGLKGLWSTYGTSLRIGTGTPAAGAFKALPTQTGTYYMVVKVEKTTGANYNKITGWVNPTYTSEATKPGGDILLLGDSGVASITSLILQAQGLVAGDSMTIDALGLSNTFTALVPLETVRVEAAANGSANAALPAKTLAPGTSLTGYAIARKAGVFQANVAAKWILTELTGSVVAADLVAAPDGKSAVFTANGPGSAKILAVTNASSMVASGVVTVSAPTNKTTRPFIWVRGTDKHAILDKIANQPWAATLMNSLQSRVAGDLASHQANRDAFLRQLPVDWTLATFKTEPTYGAAGNEAEAKFNDALDCAILYYLTGDTNYARCAADILHNTVKTLVPVARSTSTANGGWIIQDDFLYEARQLGSQLPIIYDFLYSYLLTNQVYDVKTAGMVSFNFTNAQTVFRTYYQLARDHGQTGSNWSALESTCMLNSILALDDPTERNAALQVFLVTGSSKQESLKTSATRYTQSGDIWPESLNYSPEVGAINTSLMELLERYDPALALFAAYPNIPLSLPRADYLRYPNTEEISYGDGHRDGGVQPYADYELVYRYARDRGRADLSSFYGALINGGLAKGEYSRSSLSAYSKLSQHNEPLQLLWSVPTIPEMPTSLTLPTTDTLPFAGIALQRNLSPAGKDYGLMGFVGGASHVHSHASGMSMELYGCGQVMGAKSGRTTYGDTDNENYYRLFASNNTVIVNGASRGEAGWGGFGINTVQTVSMEPARFAKPVSPNISFTCSSFIDDKGTLADGTQQRTLAIVRTSDTSGFYVDFFRSKSTVTNRVATTLNGNVTNQYHDYIYRNIGSTAVSLTAANVSLPLVSQPNRFQNDIGDGNAQPGWRYFANTTVSYPNSQFVRAQFSATPTGKSTIYMDMYVPAVASREYAKVDCPAIVDAPAPYATAAAPALVIRQIGDAWDKPFAVVYEPHFNAVKAVQNVTSLLRGTIVVGLKIESTVAGRNVIHYVFSTPNAGETYTDASIGLSFTGRFGVVTDNGDNSMNLYLGEGSSISYRGNSVVTANGAASQANVRFVPGLEPVVTANAPVTIGSPGGPATAFWKGTSSALWAAAANWNNAASGGSPLSQAPGTDTDVTFSTTSPAPANEASITLGTESSIKSLTVKSANPVGIGGANTLTVANGISVNSGAGPLTISNSSLVFLNDLTFDQSSSNAVIISAPISGAAALTKTGTGLLTLAGSNSYNGPTTISAGTLQLGNGGTTGTLNLSSTISVGTGATFAVNQSDAVVQGASFSAAPITGAGGLGKSGAGTLTLTAANTYTGNTTVSAGTLAFSNVSALSTTSAITLAGGTLLQPTLNGASVNVPITVGATTASISAPTNLPGAGVSSTFTLGGAIGGAGNVTFTSSANQNALSTVLLNAQSTYAGATLLDTNGTTATQIFVKLGIANALPTTTVLTIDGQIGSGSNRFAQLDLNGYSQRLAGLTNIPRSLRSQRVLNSSATPATLTIQNSTNCVFSGQLGAGGANLALTKSGAGIFTLSGPAVYTGATTVSAGTLALGASNVLADASAVSLGNATLNAATFTDSAGTLDVTAGATINLGAGAALAFADSRAVTWTGGTLNLTGSFVSGSSLRFGTTSAGLTATQLALISASGLTAFALDANGYLTATAPSGYTAWQSANATSQTFNQDHDDDGVSNSIEYFLGGTGNTTGFTALPPVTETAGVLSITWIKAASYPGSYGTGFVVETSPDLGSGSWTLAILSPAPGFTVTITGNAVKYTFPAGPPKAFVRLRVTVP